VKPTPRFSFLLFIALFFAGTSLAQPPDSSQLKKDSVITVPLKQKNVWLDSMLYQNKYLNLRSTPVSLAAQEKNFKGKEFLFYLLGITILLLAMSKVFYTRYFNNIFRVFFNTSLRQNQLTDLLLQAKLPSLIFNVFFVVSAGLYAWLLLGHYQLIKEDHNYTMLAFAILFVTLIYCGKFLTLKVFGWMSGMSAVTDRYIFVIFLINKIIGILLIPFIILLAFSPPQWMTVIITASGLVIGILFLLRYLRTYGLLQNDLKINAFHFLLYIAGMEVLPILILYKLVFRVIL
jgi:hypothetical protein